MRIENICSPATDQPVKNQFVLITNKYKIMQSYETPIIKISRTTNKAGVFNITVNGDPWSYSHTTSKYVNTFIYDYTNIDAGELRKAIKHHLHTFKDRLITYRIRYASEIAL